jgi:hypothetical protein
VRVGATRFHHYLRQLAFVADVGRRPRCVVAVARGGHRSVPETLAELSRRRRRAQIAARHALDL